MPRARAGVRSAGLNGAEASAGSEGGAVGRRAGAGALEGAGADSGGASSGAGGFGVAYETTRSSSAAFPMRAPADAGRSEGSLVMPRATTASSPGGRPGLRSLTFGGASDMCA